MKIAVAQMTSVDDVEKNFLECEKAVHQAAGRSAKIIFFPENCLYMRIKEGEKISGLSAADPVFQKLADLSQKHQIALHLGSVPLREGDKLSNATIFISAGQVRVTYRKIHLFDIELEGQKPIRESDVFRGGGQPEILEFEDWKFGQSICYDVRFAELYLAYAKAQVDAILIPSAFLVPTGEAHWDVLTRARAIESQAFVIAAAQAGTHSGVRGGHRSTYGHSVVIDPWGRKLVEGSGDKDEVFVVELDRKLIQSVRGQIPMQSHRRL
jgi:predicted amidohydrolase